MKLYYPALLHCSCAVVVLSKVASLTPVNNHQQQHDRAASSLWGQDFLHRPDSPELYQSSNEVDLDDIDMNHLQSLWKDIPSHQDETSLKTVTTSISKHSPSLSSSKTVNHFTPPDQHRHLNLATTSHHKSTKVFSATAPSKGSLADIQRSDITPSISTDHEASLANRYHLFNKYPWQADYSQNQLQEAYKAIGSQWRPMAKTTLYNAMDRLGYRLSQEPNRVKSIMNLDQTAIASIARDVGPKAPNQSKFPPKVTRLYTISGLFSHGVIEKAESKNRHTRSAPRWAPKDMNLATRSAFLVGMQKKWKTNEINVKSRLFRQTPESIQALIDEVLPGYRHAMSDSATNHITTSDSTSKDHHDATSPDAKRRKVRQQHEG